MRSARRLYVAHLGLGLVAVVLLGVGVMAVIDGGWRTAASGAAIAKACAGWLTAGGPASLLGIALASVAVSAAVRAVRSAKRQLLASRRFLRSLVLGPEAVIAGVRCRVVESPEPHAFCAGYLRPRIHVSRGAVEHLNEAELGAVLAHELHHRRRCDPLRSLVARTMADALFFLPVLRPMSERYSALGELAADEAAVARLKDRRPLASAMLKFSEQPAPAAVAGIDAQRVDYLLGDSEAARWRLSRVPVLASATALAGLAALISLLGYGAVDPALNLPLVIASACMAAMIGAPLGLASAAVLYSRRWLRARRA